MSVGNMLGQVASENRGYLMGLAPLLMLPLSPHSGRSALGGYDIDWSEYFVKNILGDLALVGLAAGAWVKLNGLMLEGKRVKIERSLDMAGKYKDAAENVKAIMGLDPERHGKQIEEHLKEISTKVAAISGEKEPEKLQGIVSGAIQAIVSQEGNKDALRKINSGGERGAIMEEGIQAAVVTLTAVSLLRLTGFLYNVGARQGMVEYSNTDIALLATRIAYLLPVTYRSLQETLRSPWAKNGRQIFLEGVALITLTPEEKKENKERRKRVKEQMAPPPQAAKKGFAIKQLARR